MATHLSVSEQETLLGDQDLFSLASAGYLLQLTGEKQSLDNLIELLQLLAIESEK